MLVGAYNIFLEELLSEVTFGEMDWELWEGGF